MKTLLVFCCALLFVACGDGKDSVCSKYGRMEAKCSDIPDNERADTLKVAASFCVSAHADKDDKDPLNIRAESKCASKHTDCKSYNACTKAAAKANHDKMMKDIMKDIKTEDEKKAKDKKKAKANDATK